MKRIFLALAILFSMNIDAMVANDMAVPHLSTLINDLKVEEIMYHLDENNPAAMRYEKSLSRDEVAQLKECAKKRLLKSIEDSNLPLYKHTGGFPKFQVGLGTSLGGLLGMVGSIIGIPQSLMLGSAMGNHGLTAFMLTMNVFGFLFSRNMFNEGSKLLSDGWNIAANNVKRAQQICWIVNKLK